jgi:hypothetical protein
MAAALPKRPSRCCEAWQLYGLPNTSLYTEPNGYARWIGQDPDCARRQHAAERTCESTPIVPQSQPARGSARERNGGLGAFEPKCEGAVGAKRLGNRISVSRVVTLGHTLQERS